MRRVAPPPIENGVIVAAAPSPGDDDLTRGNGGASGGVLRNRGLSADGSSVATHGSSEKDGASSTNSGPPSAGGDAAVTPLTLTTPAFTAGASIPNVHYCDGAGQSIHAVAKGTAPSFGAQARLGHVGPSSRVREDELSLYALYALSAFPTATLPSESNPTSPNHVDAIVQGTPLHPRSSAAGSSVGKYTRE